MPKQISPDMIEFKESCIDIGLKSAITTLQLLNQNRQDPKPGPLVKSH